MTTGSHPLLLYDGHCALCNTWVRILLALDRGGELRFAKLQSEFSRALLRDLGADPDELETVVFIADSAATPGGGDSPGARDGASKVSGIQSKSDAVFAAIGRLGGPLQYLSYGRFLPRFLRDGIYDLIAERRYALFGRHESCPLPQPEFRERFLDLD